MMHRYLFGLRARMKKLSTGTFFSIERQIERDKERWGGGVVLTLFIGERRYYISLVSSFEALETLDCCCQSVIQPSQ